MGRSATILFLLSLLLLSPWPSQAEGGAAPKLDPDQQRALYEANQAMVEKKDFARARKILQDFLTAHPQKDHYLLHYALGLAWHQEQKIEAAAAAYEEALRLNPDHRPSCLNLAAARYEMNGFEAAGRLWEKAFQLSAPQDSQLLYQAAAAYYQAREFGRSEAVLKRLIRDFKEPKKEWLRLLVHVLVDQKKLDQAEDLLSRFVRRFPGEADSWRLLAQVRLKRQEHLSAAAALEIAHALKPPRPEEWRALADVYFYLRAPLKGVWALKKAFGPEPTPAQCQELAVWLLEADRVDEALSYLERAISEKPTARLYLAKGQALYERGRYDEAIEPLEAAVRLKPDLHLANLLLGLSALEAGQLDLARKALERAAESKKHRAQARAALEVLARD